MYTPQLNCTVISPNAEAAEAFAAELAGSGHAIGAVDCLRDYPQQERLNRMIRLNATDLFVIDCADLPRSLHIIESIRAQNAHVEILALCCENVESLSSLMRAGVRDYIPADSPAESVRAFLSAALERLAARPKPAGAGGDIVAFLPSKPGSGASTIGAHTAYAASGAANKRVLLIDLDRDAPVQAFVNRLRPEHFLQEALANSHRMDADLWSRLISQRDNLDILPADADGAICSESGRVQELLNFLRRAYDLTCVDLPGHLDPGSNEVLVESTRIYLVCTQELASVYIALRKADRLKRLGFGRELRVLLNRFTGSHVMTAERVADLIGLPVELTIPNSYAMASTCSEKGSHVDPATPLGKSYTRLAEILLNDRIRIPRRERSFLEFLSQPFSGPKASQSARAIRDGAVSQGV